MIFFFLLFLVQPMIQKIGYFHSFAINTSRAGESRVSSRDRKKRPFGGWGMAWWGGRERCVPAALQQCTKVILTFGSFPSLTWGVGAAACPPRPWPTKGEGCRAEDQQISLLLPLWQNAIHLKISFNLEPCRVWKALQVHLGWWIGNWVYLDVGAVFPSLCICISPCLFSRAVNHSELGEAFIKSC